MKSDFKKPIWLIKLSNYEFWPFLVLYFPTAFYWTYLIIKSRSFTFFSLVNPVEEFGGFFGSEKNKVLNKIHPQYLPKTFSIKLGTSIDIIESQLLTNEIKYPFVIKPNSGERGVNVERIKDRQDLIDYLGAIDRDVIIQEFISSPIELGVFYYRLPDKTKSAITGIVDKQLLTMVGDGASTVLELMHKNDRARLQIDRLFKKSPEMASKILPKGEKYILEPIGNHNRGTMFLDGSHLINNQLVKVFDDISSNISGFYYGRFDVKVDSIEEMYKGRGIKVLEINGVYAEAAHIYDPKHSLIFAYKEIIRHMDIAYKISVQNKKRGFKPISMRLFYRMVMDNFFNVKRLT